jgi:hypothetical protein
MNKTWVEVILGRGPQRYYRFPTTNGPINIVKLKEKAQGQ